MKKEHAKELVETNNNRGYVHPLTPTAKEFINFANEAPGPMLDIGCAYGVALRRVLQLGHNAIGLDIDSANLERFWKECEAGEKDRLKLVRGSFPEDLCFEPNSLGAVLISQVLGFVSGDNIAKGFSRLYNCIAPGGKIFIVNYTPYISITSRYVEHYERKKAAGDDWPGFVENLGDYCEDQYLLENLPNQLNLMDDHVLCRELRRCGFSIESCYYMGGEIVPEKFRLDHREWINVIAVK